MVADAMATARGFTLIELMIALVIFGLLTMLALPQFTSMMANFQIRTASEALLNGLQTARGEAVKRNSGVQLILGNQTGYSVKIVSTGEVIRNRSGNEGSRAAVITVTPPGATIATFNSLGQLAANPDGSAPISQLDVSTATLTAADLRPMRIIAASAVRMCDPQVAAGDPRAC
jgi:type IV fimbrial biogenesis protein FimT